MNRLPLIRNPHIYSQHVDLPDERNRLCTFAKWVDRSPGDRFRGPDLFNLKWLLLRHPPRVWRVEGAKEVQREGSPSDVLWELFRFRSLRVLVGNAADKAFELVWTRPSPLPNIPTTAAFVYYPPNTEKKKLVV